MIKKEEFYEILGNGIFSLKSKKEIAKNRDSVGEQNLSIKKVENSLNQSERNKKLIKKIFISENKVKIYRQKY